ncbi:MAG: hypothetical protein E7040_06270 [Lentisphaerae bacterium]|nr:hypothetical protein [Lentisphaerota bacterium]
MIKVRVAQCWDDGVFTDIRLAEILKKYKAKATFNLCSGLISDESVPVRWVGADEINPPTVNTFYSGRVCKDRMMEVYGDFEVASHCDMHENAKTTDPNAFLESAMKSRRFLEDFFQKECRGFAWPFGAYTDETAKLLTDAGFVYGRSTENTDDVLSYTDPLKLASNCHFMNRLFWKKYQLAKESCGVFYFWGHSYEMADFDPYWKNFEAMIAYISNDPEAEWINVADIVK